MHYFITGTAGFIGFHLARRLLQEGHKVPRHPGSATPGGLGATPMPGAFTAIRIFAFDLDDRGQPVQVWETVVDAAEADAARKRRSWLVLKRKVARQSVS